jgi:hypothetical protein
MAVKHVVIFNRPSVDVNYYEPSEEHKAYVESQYMSTGKILSKDTVNTNFNTVRTVTTVFNSQAALDEFQADAAVQANLALRKAYNAANGIKLDKDIKL